MPDSNVHTYTNALRLLDAIAHDLRQKGVPRAHLDRITSARRIIADQRDAIVTGRLFT